MDLPKLTKTQKLVIAEMNDGEWIHPMQNIADNLGLKRPVVVRAVRGLYRLGLAQRGAAVNEDDGTMAGSGYFLTASGIRARQQVDDENAMTADQAPPKGDE